MSDAEIKEFSKTRTGSPIVKMELDTLNVAAAVNGGKVYIDDVIQSNSVINDGRRSHIGLDGTVKDFNISLKNAPFSDDFSAADAVNWKYGGDSGTSTAFSDGYMKCTATAYTPPNHYRKRYAERKISFSGDSDYSIKCRGSILTNGSYILPLYIPSISLLVFQTADPWGTADLRVELLNSTGSARINFGGYTQNIVGYLTDWWDLEMIRDNDSGQTQIIIKRNDVEVLNTLRTVASLSGELKGRLTVWLVGGGTAWFDWYKENI